MESDSIANVYSEAKSEYMLQLTQYLTPAYFRFYLDLLSKAKDDMKDTPKKYLWQFQNLLAEVEDWNMERVNREVNSITVEVERSGCDFLEDLLTAVFIAHTKVLAAVRLNSKTKNVQISLVKLDRFLFKVFCECSRLLWQSAYLFRENVGSMEKQQNYRQIQNIINDGIKAAIRSLVPVKSVLKDCISSSGVPDVEEEDSEDEEHSSAPIAPVPDHVSVPEPEPVSEPVPEPVSEPVSEPVPEQTSIPEATKMNEKELHDLPVVKALVNIQKNDEIAQLKPTEPAPAGVPTIIVDSDGSGRKGVIFNEYETIFDVDEHGQIMQPTSFHDIENRAPEPEDDDDDNDDDDHVDQIDILEETGVPLGDDDLDDLNDTGVASESPFDDFEPL